MGGQKSKIRRVLLNTIHPHKTLKKLIYGRRRICKININTNQDGSNIYKDPWIGQGKLFLKLVTEKVFMCLFAYNRVKTVVINSLPGICIGNINMKIICDDKLGKTIITKVSFNNTMSFHHNSQKNILTFVPSIFINSKMDQQMHNCSTIYYTLPLHISTLLHYLHGTSSQCLLSYVSI